MKIKCVENSHCSGLTIGKIYEIYEIDNDNGYLIIDDTNYINYYWKDRFKPLSEVRNDIIDKLLSDEVIE
jgi:hypothetical protein